MGLKWFFSRLGPVRWAQEVVAGPVWSLAPGPPLWWAGPSGSRPHCPCCRWPGQVAVSSDPNPGVGGTEFPTGPAPGTRAWHLGGGVRAGGGREGLSGGWQVPSCLSALQVDRVSYLLQEIYGIENKNNQETKVCACGEHMRGLQAGLAPELSFHLHRSRSWE